jgi:hydroxymethylbilane synthase
MDRILTERRLRIGTRGSDLARWQANWIADRLSGMGQEVEIIHITTQGDVSSQPLGMIGGQGLFTKEIQRALLDGEIDVAVHSLKDLPTVPIAGLQLVAVPERENVGDALVSPGNWRALSRSRSRKTSGISEKRPNSCESGYKEHFTALPQGARIGTGSARRRAQLLFARGDLQVLDIRGNVDTRLRKLDDGQYDAIVLAEAGMRRLGLEERITHVIPKELMLPAVGQGALGIEARSDDSEALDVLAGLNHAASHAAVLAERAMLAALEAGCLAPVGVWARISDGHLVLDSVVLASDGSRRVAANVEGPLDEALELGQRAARDLLAQGAAELIAASRQAP